MYTIGASSDIEGTFISNWDLRLFNDFFSIRVFLYNPMLLSNKDTLFPNNMFLLGNNINEGEHELCPPSFRCIV